MKKIIFTIKWILKKIIFAFNQILKKEYNDFLIFPFNTGSPMPKTAGIILKEGCDILEKQKVKYCLADGTLLGLYRDKRLIPHDTDIDITVIKPVDIHSLQHAFKINGFKIGRKVVACGEVQQLTFYKDNVIFDIIFYTEIGEYVYSFNEEDFYFKHGAIHYNKLSLINFKGHDYPIPDKTELWLENVYGTDWRIPRKSKPNDWREGGTEYLMAFPYDGRVRRLIKSLKN